MRFLLLLALASLLLLTQSTGNNANTEPPDIPTNEYDNLTPEELEPKLKQAEFDAKSEKDKYDDARKILENTVAEAERLNATYNKKKEEWEILGAAEQDVLEAERKYEENSKQLKIAGNALTEINERPEKFAAAQLELINWKQWEPSTENEKKFSDAAFNTKKDQKAQNETLIAHILLLPQPCTSESDSVECTEVKGMEEKLAKAVEEAEKAEANWQSYETNSHIDVYGMTHASLVYQQQLRKEKMDTMDADKKPIEEKKKQLEALDPELSEIVTKTTATRDRLKEASPDALVEKIKAEKAKRIADDEVSKQKEEVDKLEKISINANKDEQTLKMVYEKKKNGNTKGVDKAGFPVWIIVVLVITLLLVVVGIILFVCWKRRQKKRNEAPPPTTVSKTPKEEPKDDKEIDLDNPPADIPKETIKEIKEHVKEGVTTARRETVTVTDGNGVVKTKNEIRFLCKCNLICRVDENGQLTCVVDPKDVIKKGELVLRDGYKAENCKVHRMACEGASPTIKIEQIVHNVAQSELWIAEPNQKVIKPMQADKMTELMKHFDSRKIPDYLCSMAKPEYAGYNEVLVSVEFLIGMIKIFIEKEREQPLVLKMPSPCVVVGDTHAEYETVLRIFQTFADGETPGWITTKFVFLGDYVDRGPQAVEVLIHLMCLRIQFPDCFVMLRGNHETAIVNALYGFKAHLKARFKKKNGNRLFRLFNKAFSYMSPVCLLADTIMCMHGGISSRLHDLNSLDDLNAFNKPIDPNANLLLNDLLWGDYLQDAIAYADNYFRMNGQVCGDKQVKEFGEKKKVVGIIRAHFPQPNGFSHFDGHRGTTIFSCHERDQKAYIPHKNHISFLLVNAKGQYCPRYIYPYQRDADGFLNVAAANDECVRHMDIINDLNRNYHTDAEHVAQKEHMREKKKKKNEEERSAVNASLALQVAARGDDVTIIEGADFGV